eukprot:6029535-Pyramimonas_sp.AAC.1
MVMVIDDGDASAVGDSGNAAGGGDDGDAGGDDDDDDDLDRSGYRAALRGCPAHVTRYPWSRDMDRFVAREVLSPLTPPG